MTRKPPFPTQVPAGWPHTTDTLDCARDGEPSVHLTLGVDTHIWGLDGKAARRGALALARVDDDLQGRETTAADDVYWSLLARDVPRLGWRASNDATDGVEAAAFVRDAAGGAAADSADLVASRLFDHATAVADAIRNLYADVVFHTSGATKSPAARSAPHFAALERAMDTLLESYAENATPSPFAVGDSVKAPMAGAAELFDATVERVRVDGSVDVVFFDGDRETKLDPQAIRPKKKKNAKAPDAGMARGGMGATKKPKKKKKKAR